MTDAPYADRQRRLRQEIKTDTRKFLVQLLAGTAAALAAGVAIGRFWLFHA